jgi:hypothetical protein
MPAYLMEQLARYRREELTRQAERAQVRSIHSHSTHRRSGRLRLRRLRFKLRRLRFKLRQTVLPVEIDLRDSGSVREVSSRLASASPRRPCQASGPEPQADPFAAKPST